MAELFEATPFDFLRAVWVQSHDPSDGRRVDLGRICAAQERESRQGRSGGMDAGVWRSGGATEGVGAPGYITCPIFVLVVGGAVRRRCFPLAGSVVVLSLPLCCSE